MDCYRAGMAKNIPGKHPEAQRIRTLLISGDRQIGGHFQEILKELPDPLYFNLNVCTIFLDF